MALYSFRSVSILCQNSSTYPIGMYLHKNRKYIISSKRSLASKTPAPGKKEPDPCDYKICNKKKKKKPLWRRLFQSDEEEKPLPPVECCRLRHKLPECDPDLSEFGGQAYKTCGPAYIIQKDLLPTDSHEVTNEEKIVRKMETDFAFKDTVNNDPMPAFKSTEIKMLEMSDKRIHPLYQQYSNVKKQYIRDRNAKVYEMVKWPVDMHEIPARLNISKEILGKKNMEFMEYKRVEPPRQLVERIVEMNRNAKSTFEKKQVPVDMAEVEKRQQDQDTSNAVFDTLYQRGTKF